MSITKHAAKEVLKGLNEVVVLCGMTNGVHRKKNIL